MEFKEYTDEKVRTLELEAGKLTGKTHKKERASKGKEVSALKNESRYIDACKVVKGLKPKYGFFLMDVAGTLKGLYSSVMQCLTRPPELAHVDIAAPLDVLKVQWLLHGEVFSKPIERVKWTARWAVHKTWVFFNGQQCDAGRTVALEEGLNKIEAEVPVRSKTLYVVPTLMAPRLRLECLTSEKITVWVENLSGGSVRMEAVSDCGHVESAHREVPVGMPAVRLTVEGLYPDTFYIVKVVAESAGTALESEPMEVTTMQRTLWEELAATADHEILEVDREADAATIKKAYREKARICHPDKPGGSKELMQRLVQAKNRMLERLSGSACDTHCENDVTPMPNSKMQPAARAEDTDDEDREAPWVLGRGYKAARDCRRECALKVETAAPASRNSGTAHVSLDISGAPVGFEIDEISGVRVRCRAFNLPLNARIVGEVCCNGKREEQFSRMTDASSMSLEFRCPVGLESALRVVVYVVPETLCIHKLVPEDGIIKGEGCLVVGLVGGA